MRELLLMFNVKALSFLKGTLRWNGQAVLKNLSSIVIFGGFSVGVFFVSRFATEYLLYQAHIGQFLFHRFLSMILYVFFITVNLGNMVVSYSTLYKSQEVSFLMSLPISHAKIFLIKFVDNFFYSSITLSLVGFSVLLGYGSIFDQPWYFYFFSAFFIMLPFMLIAGIVAVLVLMSLIKIATKVGVRWLIVTMVCLYLGAIYVYFRITNPVAMVQEVMKHYPNVNEYFGYLDPPFIQYLPNHWVTEFMYWTINGDPARAIPYFAILFLTMLGLVAFASLMARKFYYKTWVAASDAELMRGPATSLSLKWMEFGRNSFLRPSTDVLIKRDFWMFFREPSQWLHLMLMMILLLIFVVSVGSLDLKLAQPFLQAVSFLVVFMFNGFLVASIALRFVFPLLSLEGDTFWAVRASPLSLSRLYWYKFIAAFSFIVVLAEILVGVSVYLLHRDVMLVGVACTGIFFVATSVISMNLGAGGYFAMFKEKNPIRVSSSQGASLTFLSVMVYLTLVATVLLIPLHEYFEGIIIRNTAVVQWLYGPLLIVGVTSIVVSGIMHGVGLRAVKRDY